MGDFGIGFGRRLVTDPSQPPNDPATQALRNWLREQVAYAGQEFMERVTDPRLKLIETVEPTVAAGVPTIGFGPAEAHTLHTVREHVPVEMLVEGMWGYVALALELGAEISNHE